MAIVDYGQVAKQNRKKQIWPAILLVLLGLGIGYLAYRGQGWIKQLGEEIKKSEIGNPFYNQTPNKVYKDLQKARKLWADGKFAEMIPVAQQALNNSTTNEEKAASHYWLGVAYYNQQKYELSQAEMETAIKLYPDYAAAYVILAAVYGNKEEYQQALVYAQKAVVLDPNDAWSYNALGVAYSNLDRKQDAINAFKKSVELDPDNIVFSQNLRRTQGQ